MQHFGRHRLPAEPRRPGGATLDDVHCGKSNTGVLSQGRTIDAPEVRHAAEQE
jgi:hypothetical protein